MKTKKDIKPNTSKLSFTYDEYRKKFFPVSAKNIILKKRNPTELGITMAKNALSELKEALQASLKV
ncbi:MAG: hypothetical protein QY332_03035 [Anaerolineales bacterium]|nr:MAG: hypothetical protein QY332_03035 [Anaerolineales bacterium]